MPSLSRLSVRSLLLVYVVDTEGFVLKKYIGVGMVLPVALTELERRCLQAGSPSRRAIIAVCGIGQHGERGGHRVTGENRTEGDTSELQSLAYLVCRPLL